jgi:hypothetical protein
MATATYNKFNCFKLDEGSGKHNFTSNTLSLYLTNTAPVATNTVYNTPADLTTGNGYTSGGFNLTGVTYTQSSGTSTLACTATPAWTASGGSIGPFRYAVLYNLTSATNPLIAWWDYGSAVTLGAGESFTGTFASNVIFTDV